eukprot:8604037-Lingulodinium_polyedra.AAC.1
MALLEDIPGGCTASAQNGTDSNHGGDALPGHCCPTCCGASATGGNLHVGFDGGCGPCLRVVAEPLTQMAGQLN